MDWFPYDRGLRHERVNHVYANQLTSVPIEIKIKILLKIH